MAEAKKQELFAPRADLVDGDDEFFIETRQTAAATAGLWRVLQLSRVEPRPYLPTVVLAGAHGSGKTTITKRFIRAARRSVACDLVQEVLARRNPANEDADAKRREAAYDAASKRRAAAWAEEMVRDHGQCAGICHPADWVSDDVIRHAVMMAQDVVPALASAMPPRPDRDSTWVMSPLWRSPGNVNHDPVRRTSMLLAEDSDRLLSVPPSRRRAVLDHIEDFHRRVVGHQVTLVLVGTPDLAEAVSEYRTTQVISIDAMPNDAAFERVCAMMFGTHDPAEVAELHRQSAGLMGRLAHVARVRGFVPPYRVPPHEIARLPAPVERED